jgi:hypothetical protein
MRFALRFARIRAQQLRELTGYACRAKCNARLKVGRFVEIPALNIPVEEFGTPGARIELHIVPQFENNKLSDADVLGNAARRTFRVSARLSHAPSIIGRINAHFDEKDGDSFLIVPSKMAQLRIDTPDGCFHIKSNDAGQLSFAEFDCVAVSPQEARGKFINAVYPALDHLSYTHNVPLFVVIIRVVDTVHQSIYVECAAPYRSQAVPDRMSLLFGEMKPVYAMYREGKNSNSCFYGFLCYYKIMEGLLGGMRANAFARAKLLTSP